VSSRRGHVEVSQVLLEHVADANAQGMKRRTPLHLASNRGNLAVTQVLLEHGADPNARNKDNKTPLHLAYMKAVTRTLLEHRDPEKLRSSS